MSKHIAGLISQGRVALILAALSLAAACSDGPTAPRTSIDRVAAARVVPSVTYARIRLAPAILNDAIRTRVVHDLQELEIALTNGDGEKARFHWHVLSTVLTDYRAQQGSVMADAADLSAIGLMLDVVSGIVDSATSVSAF